jgi:hypothetical protein
MSRRVHLHHLEQRARRRVGAVRRRLTADRAAGCLVCGAPTTAYEVVTFAGDPDLTRRVSHCTACGYVAIEDLHRDLYRGRQSLDDLPGVGARAGTRERPGREYRMGRMAIDILGRTGVDVLVYGSGRSLDNHHLAAMHRVRDVAIGDIVRLRDDAEFHDVNQPARRRFDVVVASEVVEHFRAPRADFAKLFGFVARDGLLVCGTNVYAGGDLTADRYVYWPDHTSYYTPEALLEIARQNGAFVDFRTPKLAGRRGRKRYVLFTRSPVVLQRIALYFGRRTLAPSE